jgi:hypothetical protein
MGYCSAVLVVFMVIIVTINHNIIHTAMRLSLTAKKSLETPRPTDEDPAMADSPTSWKSLVRAMVYGNVVGKTRSGQYRFHVVLPPEWEAHVGFRDAIAVYEQRKADAARARRQSLRSARPAKSKPARATRRSTRLPSP